MKYIESWVDDEDWEDERDPDWDDDEWECEFGERCLMPSFIHRRDECYTVEMAQAWQDEMESEVGRGCKNRNT